MTNLIFGWDPDVAPGRPPIDTSRWADRTMMIVYSDRVPAPGESVKVTFGIIGMTAHPGRPSRAQTIRSMIAAPNWSPGARRFDGRPTPEQIAAAREGGALACRIEPHRGGARALIYAILPGARADIPEWGDASALENLRDFLANLPAYMEKPLV